MRLGALGQCRNSSKKPARRWTEAYWGDSPLASIRVNRGNVTLEPQSLAYRLRQSRAVSEAGKPPQRMGEARARHGEVIWEGGPDLCWGLGGRGEIGALLSGGRAHVTYHPLQFTHVKAALTINAGVHPQSGAKSKAPPA
jgi:hypothetical protein